MNGKYLFIPLFLALGAGGSGAYIQTKPALQQITQPANAQQPISCQQVYGGGATCLQTGKVILNKTIQRPDSSVLAESLSINEPTFKTNQTITFHLTVTNTDTKEVNNVSVQDTLPSLLGFVSGDGQYDEKTQPFSFTIDSLNPGETKTRIVQTRVLPAEKLSEQPDTTCILNQAQASFGDKNFSQDNVQFCIENKVLGIETTPSVLQPAQPVVKTPATGAGDLALFTLLVAGLAGLFLRKRARNITR